MNGHHRQLARLLVAAAVVAVGLIATAIGSAGAAGEDPRPAPAPDAAAPTGCTPSVERDPAGVPTSDDGAASPAAATGDPGPGLGNQVTVRVPDGRLYLGPDRVTVAVHRGRAVIPDLLLADLRSDHPGWVLEVTLVSLTADGRAVAGSAAIHADRPRPIVGDGQGIRRVGTASLVPGGCARLATAVAGSGWGSYHEGDTIHLDLPQDAPSGDVEATLQFHLR